MPIMGVARESADMPGASSSAILWQNQNHTVTLLDIPKSIEAAQGTEKYPHFDHIVSCEALQVAFPSDQPKTDKARAKLTNNTVDQVLHAEYEAILQLAADDIRHRYEGKWCSERPFVSRGTKRKRKCPVDGVESDLLESPNWKDLPQAVLGRLVTGSILETHRTNTNEHGSVLAECTCIDHVDQANFFTNCTEQPATCEIKHTYQDYSFRIPPGCSAFVGDCAQSRDFHQAVRSQASAHDTYRHFDLILMDPPWPNSSVRRTHKTAGATYQTSPTMDTMYDLIVGMDLDMLMSDNCLVGVWITNKQAVRDMMLGEGGLFEQWGVELEEEWLWLKVTTNGEPMMPFDNVWRKPYEVLLLGRRRRLGTVQSPFAELRSRRRVLVGVPDLHSRKPCLKQLLDPLLPEKSRALEVFARHLVAGWWSWGDECIKFNWDGFWQA